MEPVNDFFTLESLATLSGATLATLVVSNTFRAVFKKDPVIFAFIFSVALCILFVALKSARPIEYFVALINGCLVYCTAFGLNNQMSSFTAGGRRSRSKEAEAASAAEGAGAHFFGRWNG